MYELALPAAVKTLARSAMPAWLWQRLKEAQRDAAFASGGPYSFDEPTIIRWVDEQTGITPFFIDIGAQDGVLGSQTLALAKRGWAGLNYEADPALFNGMERRYRSLPMVSIRKEMVTPDNIVALLQRDDAPARPGFMSLDIDSFDYFVLSAILETFTPSVICVEINEMIPPPILFTVAFDESAAWAGDRFQGFSIQSAKRLCNRFGYQIGELHYNNLLLIKSDSPGPHVTNDIICKAYSEGYASRPDRVELFPWNIPFSHMLTSPAPAVLAELEVMFAEHMHRCELMIDVEKG